MTLFIFSAGFYRNSIETPNLAIHTYTLFGFARFPSFRRSSLSRKERVCQVFLHFIRPEHISWTKKTQSVWHVVSRQTETCSRLRKYFSRHQKTAVHHDLIFVFQQESRHILPFIPFIPFLFCADSATRYNRQIKRLHSNSEIKFG
jgi:hypothetical protein